VNVRSRSATIVAGLLLSCSLMFGNWTQLNPGILGGVYNGVCFLPGNTQVGYACGAGLDTASHMPKALIIKTTDGGNTWTQQNPNTVNMLLAIYLSNADTGYACGEAGTIVRTTDGGTWQPTSAGNFQLNYVSFPSNGQTGYIGINSDTFAALVYRSTDYGGSWARVSVGGPLDRSRSCAMANDSTGIVFGPNAFVYGEPGGYQDPQAPGCIMIAASYSKSDNNKAYLVGNDTALGIGIVRYTATGGQPKWDSVSCPVVASFSCVTFANPETAYIGGANGFIGITVDAHDVWQTLPTGVTSTISSICFPHGSDTGYATAGPVILKTTDAGGLGGDWVAEGKLPAAVGTGIRVMSNPSRRGISYRADAEAWVTVFDAAGQVVAKQNAAKGMNFLPLFRAGVYLVKATAAGFTTTRKLVVER
jgi:photosystem II stability/assembly factor-like uncharacterized protein